MAASHVREFHRRNAPRRIYFFTFDTAGAVVAALTTPDTEISKDGGAFADCTNEATAVSDGLQYIDLTATETNADRIAIIVKAANAAYTPTVILSDAVLELSQVNVQGSVTGSVVNIVNSLLNSGGRGIDIAATGGHVITVTAHSASTNGINMVGSFRGSHAINTTQWLGAGFCSNGNDIGISFTGCGDGISIVGNSRKMVNATHAISAHPGIMISGTSINRFPLIHIVGESTGNVPAVMIETVPTGGGNAIELKTRNYVSFSLSLNHANATGQCINFGGYLPEPTMPIDKDTWTIMDALGFIAATMANRTTLNKDTLTHTLFKRDNSSTLVTRAVSDDGTTQSMSATD